jgi:hypothetical protein
MFTLVDARADATRAARTHDEIFLSYTRRAISPQPQ